MIQISDHRFVNLQHVGEIIFHDDHPRGTWAEIQMAYGGDTIGVRGKYVLKLHSALKNQSSKVVP